MLRSDRARLAAVLAALALPVALVFACNQLTGIAGYANADCDDACAGGDLQVGGSMETGVGDQGPAMSDAGDAADGQAAVDAPLDVQLDALPAPAPALLWARWPMPNSPDGGVDANIASYANGATGVVDDGVTMLEWTAGTGMASSFEEAYAYCLTLQVGQLAGWRLPTRIELASLIDWTQTSPTIDPTAFPDAARGEYWTWSVVAGTDGGAYWSVDFDDGTVTNQPTSATRSVRCVRP